MIKAIMIIMVLITFQLEIIAWSLGAIRRTLGRIEHKIGKPTVE